MTAYWTIRARLLEVPGVANVALWNERLQMMTVQVDPDRMAQRDVSLDQVMEATADAVDSGLLRFSSGSVIGTGGMVETPNQRLSVRNVLPIITPADLAQVPVDSAPPPAPPPSGEPDDQAGEAPPPPPVQLGDVADVLETNQPLIGDAIINDSPGLLLVVEKLPWANTVEMTRGVEDVDPHAGARPARRPLRHDDLPAGQLHRARHRQPDPGARAGVPPGRGDPGAVPLRVAGRADQPAHHPAVAHGDAAGAAMARADGQHHGPGRSGDRARSGRRRRDHRRGEHRAAVASAPTGRREPGIHRLGDPARPRWRSGARSSSRR